MPKLLINQAVMPKNQDTKGRNIVKMAPYFPHETLRWDKPLEENDNYIFFDEVIYDRLYPDLRNILIEEIKKITSLPRKDLPLKLIDIREAEKNLRAGQLEKLKSESVKEVENGMEKYAILSYVWGKNEASVDNSSKILNNSGRKSLIKAIETCKYLDINYLWMDQLCVNQKDDEAISYQISKLGQYYSNATVTLTSIQARVLKEHEKKKKEKDICLLDVLEAIVNSRWFSRPWTYQEGWLSRRSIFMFDDCLVSGQALAETWVLHQPSWAKVKFSSYEESIEGSVKIATPLGWIHYKDGYLAEDKFYIDLHEALKEVRKRGKNELIEGIYSILGLLPYGEKVRVRWKKAGYEYAEEEFQKILLDIVKVAIEEGYGKDFENLDFIDISEKIREEIKELCRLKDEQTSLSFCQEVVTQKNTYPLLQ
jgi:hypothetical protein